MTNRQIREAYDKISPSPETAEMIWLRAAENARKKAVEEQASPRDRRGKNARRTLLIAAVIASLMTATAVAADFYGIKTVTIEGSRREQLMATTQPDGSFALEMTPVEELGGTLPYDGPDWAMEWVDKARTAFQEYRAYKDEKQEKFFAERMPNIAAFEAMYCPPGADWEYDGCFQKDNGDGTYSITCYTLEPVPGTEWVNDHGETIYDYTEVPDPSTTITIDKAEIDAYMEYLDSIARMGSYGDYHHIYSVQDAEDAAMLESIAAKYGLSLRSGESVKFGGAGEDNEQLEQQLSEAAGSGPIYREAPEFDHYSYYDSGSFQSSAAIPLPDGRRADTYLCSTAYGEMVDGREVGGMLVREDQPMVTRAYTAADGTELAISQNGSQAVIYAYLEKSYITVTVSIYNWASPGVPETDFSLSEENVNYIADFINYKNIGK